MKYWMMPEGSIRMIRHLDQQSHVNTAQNCTDDVMVGTFDSGNGIYIVMALSLVGILGDGRDLLGEKIGIGIEE